MTKYRAVPSSESRSGIGYVIAVQVAAGIVLAVWTFSSGGTAAVTGTIATTLIAGRWCATHVRVIRSLRTRIMFRINGSRTTHLREPVDFADIPAAGGPLTDALVVSGARSPEAPGIGVAVSPGVLVTTIRVRPPSPAVSYLDRTGRDSGPGAELSLSPAPLAECLAQFDIALHSIDIVVHTRSAAESGPVSRSYANTLGPIRATPRTSVHVLVRLDPRDCPEAITRRGGGAEGTARTLAVATRRVAARITEQGLTADILSADEASGILRELTGGQDPAKPREAWDHARSGSLLYRTVPLDRGGAAERYADIDTATHPAAHPTGEGLAGSGDGQTPGTVSTT
ncbi:MAG: type VII secretion protein EccE, partial [Gordonia amarae]